MSYVDKVLLPNEEKIYIGNRSFFSLLPMGLCLSFAIPTLLSILGLIVNSSEKNQPFELTFFIIWFGVGLVLFFIFYLIAKLLINKTELVITNKRIIAKYGIIRVDTIDIHFETIDSVSVEQSFLGRIFNYGSIVIHGYGGSKTPIMDVADPIKFKRELDHRYDQFKTHARS